MLFGGNGHFLPTKQKPQKIREHNFHNMLFPLSNPKYTQRFKFSHFVRNEQFENRSESTFVTIELKYCVDENLVVFGCLHLGQLQHRFLHSSAEDSSDNIQARSSERSQDVCEKSTIDEGDLDVEIYSGAASKKIAQFQDGQLI